MSEEIDDFFLNAIKRNPAEPDFPFFPDTGRAAAIEVLSQKPGVKPATIIVDGISAEQVVYIGDRLASLLGVNGQASNAVARVFEIAVETCPAANPSDLWHQVVYRQFRHLGYSEQQWRRVSGFALERALASIYTKPLEDVGLAMRPYPEAEACSVLRSLNLPIPTSKVDMFLETRTRCGPRVFGAVHVKASVAERIQDDVPASRACMRAGLLSVVLTMDAKSFPPPHGDGVNYGELGGRLPTTYKTRPKRDYIETKGQFDALFSYNHRTPPSPATTPSGKRIHTLGLSGPWPDAFVTFLLQKQPS